MRLSNRRSHHATRMELSMTGMIDVVFLLLIFFLVTSAFVAPEHHLRSGIKFEAERAATRPHDLEPAIIELTMVDGRLAFRIGGLVCGERGELRSVLAKFPNKLDGAVVRASDEVLADAVAKAIADCKACGFSLVTYVPL